MIIFKTIVSIDADTRALGLRLIAAVDRLTASTDRIGTTLGKIANSQSRIADAHEALVAVITAALSHLSAPNVVFITAGQSMNVPGLTPDEGEDMSKYTVARDHPDEPILVAPITASDSEGPVPVDFTERIESSDEAVVSLVDTEGGGKSLHFGTEGGAHVDRIVTYQGNDFIVSTLTFNITFGAITFTGDMTVPGLTPDPES